MSAPRSRIGLVFGGQSPEHEVSIATARNVAAAIDRERWDVVPIGIARNGTWLVSGDPFARLTAGETPVRSSAWYCPLEPTAGDIAPPDVFMPVIHGAGGEDGRLQGYFETLGRPYTGGGVLALAAGMDKWLTRQVWASAGLPTVPFVGVTQGRWRTQRDAVLEDIRPLGLPLFVKPANLGSSIGVVKVRDAGALDDAMAQAFAYDRRVLVDRAIDAREIELGVLGGDDPLVSQPGEVIVADEFYTFHDKYVGGRSSVQVPADLTPAQVELLRAAAGRAFRSLDGHSMARVDFFLSRSTGEIYLNEINFVPGFTNISMYPRLMATVGLSYPALITRILELALERHAEDAGRQRSFSSGSSWFTGNP
jgi:D-alanine-D-alanine ligase